jgi:hypothetical protein
MKSMMHMAVLNFVMPIPGIQIYKVLSVSVFLGPTLLSSAMEKNSVFTWQKTLTLSSMFSLQALVKHDSLRL